MSGNPILKNNVTVINPAANKTMLFAHGFGSDQTAWANVVPAFAKDHRVVLYDNVGAGKSDPEAFSPNRYDSLHSYAEDLVDIADALHIKDAIMVGHSVSAMISLLVSIKRPDIFDKLIFVGASPRYLNDGDYIGGFTQQALDDLFEEMDNNYFSWVSGFAPVAMANLEKPELAASYARTLAAIRPDIGLSVARVIFYSDHRSDLPKLQKQTLIIQTKKDIAVPIEVGHYLHQHIAGSTLKLVNAEGHFPHMSHPEEIITVIKNFIQ